MSQEASEIPVFACCSIGIGRWFWVAWESEGAARGSEPPMASGYEASAARAEAKARDRLGGEGKRLPAKWASSYKRGGAPAPRRPIPTREVGSGERAKPKAKFSRLSGLARRVGMGTRLAFLYCVTEREPPDALGHVTVVRHRIVKQGPRKIHVDCDPFDEDAWARRVASGEDAATEEPRPRTIAVDRATLRAEVRFRARHAYRELTFYASEDAGIRDVEAELTARHAWCATLGVHFPCSAEAIKAAFRRLAITAHPDAGGDPAAFRQVEQAYRDALAYFGQSEDETG